MNKPQFVVRINNNNNNSCIGTQLVLILNLIHPFIKEYIWYGSDVEVNGIFVTSQKLMAQPSCDLRFAAVSRWLCHEF